MRRFSEITLLCYLASSAVAIQLPFDIPFFRAKIPLPSVVVETQHDTTVRIAVIGAGAGGSSAAFWISKAKERFGIDVEVDVYEKESYIGGRSTVVYPHNDTGLPSIELGASIFVAANRNLWRASDEFNLTRDNFENEGREMGIWDGEKFLLTIGADGLNGWWDTAKVLWRYGYTAPTRTQAFVQNLIKQILVLYDPTTPKWDSISGLAETLGWTDMISQTTSEYLEKLGVSQKYSHELVEAATRVNYGQDVDYIHALEGACSLAADNAVGIKGGNFLLFENFLKRSGARVFLNTKVDSITKSSSTSSPWTIRSSNGTTNYRAVIFAAPFHSSGIKVPSELSSQIPEQPYVHLHVTLLTTTSPYMSPEYFSLSANAKTPSMVLTTYEGARKGGKEPEFNSVSYHHQIKWGAAPEWSAKIFSKERVSDEWLAKVFRDQVTWVYRKEWDAYPKLPPTNAFAPVKLDQGFYYVNAFEPMISTMETETIASRNVVDLLLHEEFNSGICGSRISASTDEEAMGPSTVAPGFVYGWDC